MKTFKGTTSMDFKIVVPDQFLADLRAAAQADDATPFLKQLQERHPENDDAFLAALLSNGVRKYVRNAVAEFLVTSGLGCTLSPATITVTEAPRDHDAAPAVPQVVEVDRQQALRPELAAPYGFTEPVHDYGVQA